MVKGAFIYIYSIYINILNILISESQTSEMTKDFHSVTYYLRVGKDMNYPSLLGALEVLSLQQVCQNKCWLSDKILLLMNDKLENVFYTVFCSKESCWQIV